MAKKKIEVPVYPTAPLIIAKEKFGELLNQQIKKGNELLEINVPVATYNDPYMGYQRRPVNSMEYDETAQNDFIARFNRWHERNKEIYRSSFAVPNSIYFHEYESQIFNHLIYDDIIKLYKEEINRLMNHMQSDIERVDLMGCSAIEADMTTLPNTDTQVHMIKPYKIFISHCSKDKNFAEALIDLLESLGFDESNVFCSSVDGYGVGLSKDIFETLRSLFKEYNLYVIFIHSPRYYNSPVSLNEMGAAWVLRTDFCSFLTTDMNFDMMKGVVNGNTISIKVNNDDATSRLTELKDKLIKVFSLNEITVTKWERKRQAFLDKVMSFHYNAEADDSPNAR